MLTSKEHPNHTITRRFAMYSACALLLARPAGWLVVCGVLSGDGYTLHIKPVGQSRLLFKVQIERNATTDLGLTLEFGGNILEFGGISKSKSKSKANTVLKSGQDLDIEIPPNSKVSPKSVVASGSIWTFNIGDAIGHRLDV